MTAAGDRNQQRRAVDDCREDDGAQVRGIHCVDRNTQRLSICRHPGVECFVIRRGNCQHGCVQIRWLIATLTYRAIAAGNQLAQRRLDLGRHHIQRSTRFAEQASLAQGNFTTANNQHAAAGQIMKQGQEFHARFLGIHH